MTTNCLRGSASLSTLCFIFILIFAAPNLGQTSPSSVLEHKATPTPSLERKFFSNILRDQRAIWLSPLHLQRSDAKWMVPLGLSSAVLVATDRRTSGALVENGDNLTRLRISKDISRLGSWYATGGVAAAFYIAGRAKNNARERETGLLGAEALINSGIVAETLKTVSQRQRPPVDHTSGEFFDGGRSFPSGHATSAWSLATVIAHEYGQHRPLVSFGAYGLATAVSLSRYTGRNHFLSDALVGSAIGYGIGRYVYRQHHDRALDSPNGQQTTGLAPSKLLPRMAPIYSPQAHTYGALLSWSF